MISSEVGQAAFRLGFFVAFVSGILCFMTEPGTAERVVSLLTFIISVIFLAIVVFLVRFGRQRDGNRDD